MISEILKCPKRDHPQYGYVRVTGYYYPGSTAYYQCRRGYEIYGDARLTCLETGYWGGNVPVCKSEYYRENIESMYHSYIQMHDDL